MAISPFAGKRATRDMLVDLARLEREYYERKPDVGDSNQLVSFGTSGHRGSSSPRLVQRSAHSCHHAGHLRLPARSGHRWSALHGQGHARAVRAGQRTALEVLGGERGRDHHPAATTASRRRRSSPAPSWPTTAAATAHLADGIVVTPSHNPPEDGGFKYNPPNGGPADTDVTRWVQDRANALLRERQRRRQARAVREGAQGGDHAAGRFRPALCARSSERDRHGDHPRGGSHAGRGSARRRRGAITGSRSTRSIN